MNCRCKSTRFPPFCQVFDFAFTLQSVCKMFACRLCADGKDEFVPFPGSPFAVEHLFIKSAAHGADGTCIAGQHNGHIRRSNPELDKQTYLILQFRHCMEISQLATEAWINLSDLALYFVPVVILQYIPCGDAALQGLVFVGCKVGRLY